MAGFRQAPISRSVTDAATWAMRELAQRGAADAHRVRVPDALIAAATAERGFGVLHYDHHFDTLATKRRDCQACLIRSNKSRNLVQ
jgi:predicted nucleic acid-binding protein